MYSTTTFGNLWLFIWKSKLMINWVDDKLRGWIWLNMKYESSPKLKLYFHAAAALTNIPTNPGFEKTAIYIYSLLLENAQRFCWWCDIFCLAQPKSVNLQYEYEYVWDKTLCATLDRSARVLKTTYYFFLEIFSESLCHIKVFTVYKIIS